MRGLYRFVLALLLLVAGSGYAQNSSTGNIRGTVTDASGGVIPGAVITVSNIDTGVTKTFTTNSSGLYDTVSTPIGNYRVTFAKDGFERLVRGPVVLNVGAITLDGHLTIGSVQ